MAINFSKIRAFLSLSFAAAVLVASSAHAGLVGQTASVAYYYPDNATPYGQANYSPQQFTIDAEDLETVVNIEDSTFLLVDFFDSSLQLDFFTLLDGPTFNTTSFNGLIFNLLSAPAWPMTVASITSNLIGVPSVSIVNDQLRINMSGLTYHDGASVLINFKPTHGVPVSEPPVLALLLLALSMSLLAGRNKYVHGKTALVAHQEH